MAGVYVTDLEPTKQQRSAQFRRQNPGEGHRVDIGGHTLTMGIGGNDQTVLRDSDGVRRARPSNAEGTAHSAEDGCIEEVVEPVVGTQRGPEQIGIPSTKFIRAIGAMDP